MTLLQRVAFIGVGNMGGAMAANLLAKGWPVSVADIDAEKVTSLECFGAEPLDIRAQAAPDLIATVVCVVDAAQTETVLFGPDGLAGRLQPGQLVLLCPTLAPQDVESFAARLAARGITMLDAPMSGGPVRAREGSMTLMIAGMLSLCQPWVAVLHEWSVLIMLIGIIGFNVAVHIPAPEGSKVDEDDTGAVSVSAAVKGGHHG